MTDDEDLQQVRRGYWLKLAREQSGFTLAAAAKAAGLADSSGSTVSLWEAGQRSIKVIQMERLARAYGVPSTLFLTPGKTDEERLREAIDAASAFEQEDSDREGDRGPGDGDEPGASPRRQLS